MNYDNPFPETANGKTETPQGLKTLSILSFIGCGIQFFTSLFALIGAKANYEQSQALADQMKSGEMPGWMSSITGDPAHFIEIAKQGYQNRLPIFIIGVLAVALCLYGVILMRKLNRQGFLYYVIGQILPFLSMVLFLGVISLKGFAFIFSVVITALFIFLYSRYLKRMA